MNKPIGYTAPNLLSSLSVCSDCTHNAPLVVLPIKSSPNKRKNPNGIKLPHNAKNITSIYSFLFSSLAIFLSRYRIAIVDHIAIPTK